MAILVVANIQWHTWIVVSKFLGHGVVYKPLVANGVVYKPFVAYVDRLLQAFGGIRGSSFANLWWLTWIVACKPLAAYVDRPSQAFGGKWSRLQAFGRLRGSSFPSLSWHTWITCTTNWWHTIRSPVFRG